jgi:hypothetical protein
VDDACGGKAATDLRAPGRGSATPPGQWSVHVRVEHVHISDEAPGSHRHRHRRSNAAYRAWAARVATNRLAAASAATSADRCRCVKSAIPPTRRIASPLAFHSRARLDRPLFYPRFGRKSDNESAFTPLFQWVGRAQVVHRQPTRYEQATRRRRPPVTVSFMRSGGVPRLAPVRTPSVAPRSCYSSPAISSTRSTMRRRNLGSLMRINALVSASPSVVARKSDT